MNKLQSDTIKKLREEGIFCWRQNNQPTHDPKMNGGYGGYRAHAGLKGVPDIIAIFAGQFIGIEIKSGKDKMSADQKLFERRCKNNGGKYFIVKDIKDVDKLLTMLSP